MGHPVAANWVSLKNPTTFKAICFQQQPANNSCVKLEELVDPKFSTFEGCFSFTSIQAFYSVSINFLDSEARMLE
jgi:hypothetical protein